MDQGLTLAMVIWGVCGAVGFAIGSNHGNAGRGAFYGFLFGPLGVLAAAALPSFQKSARKCPDCCERIKEGAKICRFCRADLSSQSSQSKNNAVPIRKTASKG